MTNVTFPDRKNRDETFSQPTFDAASDPPGVSVYDPIEKVRAELRTDHDVAPTPASTDEFPVPMDTAATVSTSRITIPYNLDVAVWSGDERIARYTSEPMSVPVGSYFLEFNTLPVKIYVGVESAVRVRREDESTIIEFDGERELLVGARSFHRQPTGTITVTDDVEDVMRALSLFGSAMKTTSPERSYPNLRGHPPLIERGDEFSAPDDIESPRTGVELVVPPTREYVYPLASLAYYLGADVVPGDSPRLVADGFEYSLDGPDGYEKTVNRVLRHVFYLDCFTRSEGFYSEPVHERTRVESQTSIDFPALYEASHTERLRSYLSIPFENLEPWAPQWHLTTDVVPAVENDGILSFVANDLSFVRCPSNPTDAPSSPPPAEIGDFCRSVATGEDAQESEQRIVEPQSVETIDHAWVGDGCPLGSNKLTLESRRQRIEREPAKRQTIRIRVVCNDNSMKAEGAVNELYGFRKSMDYDVDIAYNLTTAELRELLATDIDFFHYIGHIDHDGVQCADGVLDTTTLDTVGVRSFLLNACRSYEQGSALVEKGSQAGVVTLSDVSNHAATKVGRTLARLLNVGFPFRAALSIAQKQSLTGYQYVVVGDGGIALCQSPSGTCTHTKVTRRENHFAVEKHGRHLLNQAAGGTFKPYYGDGDICYLSSGYIDTFDMTSEELNDLFEMQPMPIEYDGDLYWSEDITASDLD